MTFTANSTGGLYQDSSLRATIGAIDSNASAIGYVAAGKVKGQSYSYGFVGSGQTTNISESRINHATLVKREDGGQPSLVQPYIIVYFWRRIS